MTAVKKVMNKDWIKDEEVLYVMWEFNLLFSDYFYILSFNV